MKKIDRRKFIRNLLLTTGTVGLFPTGTLAFDNQAIDDDLRPFEMLAIGDSVMWGQGLRNENKFSYKTKNWLETQVFNGKRLVNLHVKAHSGAAITLKTQKKIEPLKYHNGEINLWTPSINQQADDARDYFNLPVTDRVYKDIPVDRLNYYKGNSITPQNVDLILVNGGINDMGAAKILIPAFGFGVIKNAAEKYCYLEMTSLLKKLAVQFPNAKIVVTNYFPLVSTSSDAKSVYEAVGEAFGENPFTDYVLKLLGIFDKDEFKRLHFIRNFLAKRSATWVGASNSNLKKAVEKANRDDNLKTSNINNSQRFYFAQAGFEKENAYAAERTFLWRLIDKTRVNDERFADREAICKDEEVEGLNRFERFVCRRAGLFHPNVDGANSYFEAIKGELKDVFRSINAG